MALNEDLVEVGRNEFDEPVIHCVHCHQAAEYTQTVGEGDTAVFELMCPGPGATITLGSWPNEQQRETDIRNFIERRTRHHAVKARPIDVRDKHVRKRN